MTSAQDRVQDGFAFLDAYVPGHVETFNPDEFDIMNGGPTNTARGFNRCVLMQATDTDYWWDACQAVGLNQFGDGVVELGFYPQDGDDTDSFDQDIKDLNVAWLAAYAERKAA